MKKNEKKLLQNAQLLVNIEEVSSHHIISYFGYFSFASYFFLDRELTSWESCNFVLKGFVQEFIELGASPQLRVIAFQLWANYLQKANVAFFSKQTDKLPFLPLGFKSRFVT